MAIRPAFALAFALAAASPVAAQPRTSNQPYEICVMTLVDAGVRTRITVTLPGGAGTDTGYRDLQLNAPLCVRGIGASRARVEVQRIVFASIVTLCDTTLSAPQSASFLVDAWWGQVYCYQR